jgi:hypothetical protein
LSPKEGMYMNTHTHTRIHMRERERDIEEITALK